MQYKLVMFSLLSETRTEKQTSFMELNYIWKRRDEYFVLIVTITLLQYAMICYLLIIVVVVVCRAIYDDISYANVCLIEINVIYHSIFAELFTEF